MICYICGRDQDYASFKKAFWNKTPGREACGECWNEKNEKRKEYSRRYYKNNRLQILEYQKQLIDDKREHFREKWRKDGQKKRSKKECSETSVSKKSVEDTKSKACQV